jgi:squalene-hopene/tetraprenyl-beta-curcumene cyclase
MNRRTFFGRGFRATALVGLAARSSRGQAGGPADPAALTARAADFLRPRQSADGSWSGDRKEPGITALAVAALLRSRRATPDDPAVARGLAYLEQFLDTKGGLARSPHSVYTTSVALMAFQEANRGGRYAGVIRGGQDYLRASQYGEAEGKGPADPQYGGVGYGGASSRPDLSNTAFMMEALRDSGLPADDPALKKALVFVSRCQNRKSEFNDQPWADKVNDGGFVYNPSGRAESPQGKGARRGEPATEKAAAPIPSSAGMTYAGLKSMIYAGLTEDDGRVKAALAYIAGHYTLDENPGQGQRGLYYYYHTFARALAALGKPTLVDAEGKSHDWRADLVGALAKRQEASGAWVNRDDRFMEGDPNIVTSFGLLALAAARPKG